MVQSGAAVWWYSQVIWRLLYVGTVWRSSGCCSTVATGHHTVLANGLVLFSTGAFILCLIRKLYSKLSHAKSETHWDGTPPKHPVSKCPVTKCPVSKYQVSKRSFTKCPFNKMFCLQNGRLQNVPLQNLHSCKYYKRPFSKNSILEIGETHNWYTLYCTLNRNANSGGFQEAFRGFLYSLFSAIYSMYWKWREMMDGWKIWRSIYLRL